MVEFSPPTQETWVRFPANAVWSCLFGASLVAQKVNNTSEEVQEAWAEEIPWRRKWQPTPVFLPGESHGQRNATVQGVARSPKGLSDQKRTDSRFLKGQEGPLLEGKAVPWPWKTGLREVSFESDAKEKEQS